MKLLRLYIFLFFTIGILPLTHAQISETKARSIFVYSISRYVGWENVEDNLVIGVYGQSKVYPVMHKDLTGRKVGGKDVVTREVSTIADISSCSVLYIPASASSHFNEIIEKARKHRVLVITEENLAEEGANISFITKKDGKLGFIINRQSLDESNLKVGSNLYSLGEVI